MSLVFTSSMMFMLKTHTVLVPGKIVYKSRVFVNFNVSSVQPITLKLATAVNSRIGARIGDQSMERPVSKLRV